MAIIDVANLQPVTAAPEETVQAAIERMVEANVGSVAVCDGTRLAGIFTERDVLRLAATGVEFGRLRLSEAMTTRLVTVSPDDDIVAVAHLMGERQIRHVPVLEGDNLVGVVGIRDILGVLAELIWRTRDTEAHDTVRELLARPPS
jgi:CBS domain-containing protein